MSKLSMKFSSLNPVSSGWTANKSSQHMPTTKPINLDDFWIYVLINDAANKEDYDLPIDIESLSLHRTFSHGSKCDSFLKILARVEKLKKLDLSGNRAGPVALRALIATLTKHDIVEELNISDNLGDHDCFELIRQYLSTSKSLVLLDISNNQLGRSSLPRSLANALQVNENLVELNISNCGATNLHVLFEGIRSTLSLKTSALKFLNVSDNVCHDGDQLGQVISLVLAHQRCTLAKLNISNVGLNPMGWESIIPTLKNSHSLKELVGGGSFNCLKNILQIMDILFVSKTLNKLDLNGIKSEETVAIGKKAYLTSFSYLHCSLESPLRVLNLCNCDLTNEFIAQLANRSPGKLSSISFLDLSFNSQIDTSAMREVKNLFNSENNCLLQSLNLSSLNVKQIFPLFPKLFPNLTSLNLSDCCLELSENDFSLLKNGNILLEKLILNRISHQDCFEFLSIVNSLYLKNLVSLSLSGCDLCDSDFDLLISVMFDTNANTFKLKFLDVSVNCLVNGITALASHLLQTQSCSLENLNIACNKLGDEAALELSKFLLSSKTKSKLHTLDFSNNYLSKAGIVSLINCLNHRQETEGLVNLDVSNQKCNLSNHDFQEVSKTLSSCVSLNKESLLTKEASTPSSQMRVNLNQLGGRISFSNKFLLQLPQFTSDLLKQVRYGACLTDYLLFAAALDSNFIDTSLSVTEFGKTAAFSIDLWQAIVGPNSPAWLKKEQMRIRTVYVNHLPEITEETSVKNALESVKGCLVESVFLIKDTALKKTTSAAWILLKSKESKQEVLKWFLKGKARVDGNLISISSIPVSVLKAKDRVKLLSKQEIHERELEKKHSLEKEDVSDTTNILIADEYAAYMDLD